MHVNVQRCRLIIFHSQAINLQYQMSNSQTDFDCVLHRHHWELLIDKRIISMLACPILLCVIVPPFSAGQMILMNLEELVYYIYSYILLHHYDNTFQKKP